MSIEHSVRHVLEVDPIEWTGDRSNQVDDYLADPGWILLGAGTHAWRGDDGPFASIYYSVGWLGEADPRIPPARPR